MVRYLLTWIVSMFVVYALIGENGLTAFMQVRRQYRGVDQSLAAVRTENDRLRKEIRLLRDDPTTIEGVARRELGLTRPGETMFIIKDTRSPAP